MLARTTALALAAILAAGCARTVEATWPDTGAARYSGPVTEVNGELRAQGPWRFWHPNGALFAAGDFRAAPLPGADQLGPDFTRVPRAGRARWWTFRDDAGRMLAEGRYRAGLRSKLWVCWYPNGRQCCTGHFSEGLAHGYHVTWNPDGSKREERTYERGLLEGRRTVWSAPGIVVWSGEYRAGELVAWQPPELSAPPLHELAACAERAESGLARSVDVAGRRP